MEGVESHYPCGFEIPPSELGYIHRWCGMQIIVIIIQLNYHIAC